MHLFLFGCIFTLLITNAQAQKAYIEPNFAVQYISYFGIGSASVQKPAVIGYNAANYALMQQALPESTEQGLGIPVYFYKKTIESCGADQLILNLNEDYNNLNEKELILRLQKIRAAIIAANIPKSLSNQLKNAVDEFYKGKKIRLSSSPNFLLANNTFSIVSSVEDLMSNIIQVYASFWTLEAVKARFSSKNLNKKRLALGILLTQGFEYGYAIGKIQTDYSTKEPSINILSKRESSTERISFPRFDSKWYRTQKKAEKTPVFVDNAALTPTVRDLQKAIITLDSTLRTNIYNTAEFSNKDYSLVFTFIIKKVEGEKFTVKFQQPELLF